MQQKIVKQNDVFFKTSFRWFYRLTLGFSAISLLAILNTLNVQKAEAEINPVTTQLASRGLVIARKNPVLYPKPVLAEIAEANKKKPILEEQERKAIERENKINKLVAFLKKQKSPIANFDNAAQIVDLSEKNKADYRIIVGIMGVESGFCRAPYWINGNSHNCFGYLNGRKYSSYTDALADLVPKISRQYVAKFGWNLEAFSKAYGELNWQKCSAEIRYYANQL